MGNTPVQNPVTARLDWLGYTVDEDTDLGRLWEGGEAVRWEPQPGQGRYGYREMWRWQGVEMWTGHHNAAPHVDASGKGCRDIEQAATAAAPGWGWAEHLAWLLSLGAKVSRLDLALDVVDGSLDVETLASAVRSGHVVSRWKAGSWREMRGIGQGVRGGHTLYGGKPASDAMLLVYDKAAEQGWGAEQGPWVRVEMRCRANTAKAMARAIAIGGLQAGVSALRGYVDFKDPSGRTIPGWEATMQGASAAPLHVVKRGGTLDSTLAWLEDDVAASLAMALEVAGGDVEWLAKLVERGKARYNAKHRSIIAQKAMEGGRE